MLRFNTFFKFIWQSCFHVWPLLMSFRHIWHICQKNKDVGDVMVQKQYVFYKGTVKLFFVELQHRNLTAKNWLSIFYSFVTAHCKQINFRWLFCLFRDSRTVGKWTCLVMKMLKSCKSDTYWLTLLVAGYRICVLVVCHEEEGFIQKRRRRSYCCLGHRTYLFLCCVAPGWYEESGNCTRMMI